MRIDLIYHFKEVSFGEQKSVQDDGKIIGSAIYSGPKCILIFGNYYNKHSRALVKFLKVGTFMITEQQMNVFIQDAQCPKTKAIVINLSVNSDVCTSVDTYYKIVPSYLELPLTLAGKASTIVTKKG